MKEFQGWTPATIDNLTFDQLEAYYNVLNEYRKNVLPTDIAIMSIRQVLFKYLGIKENKKDEDIDLSRVPSAKGTSEEIRAWINAGCPPTFASFVKKYRKET